MLPATQNLLAKHGVSFEAARSFIYSNVSQPSIIYQTAAQFGITFDMLADLYGQGTTGEVVKGFFHQQGMSIDGDAPVQTPAPAPSNDVSQGTIDLLSSLGVSLEEARAFIESVAGQLESLYTVAAQNGISFDMLAELYGNLYNSEDVKALFAAQGLSVEGSAPVIAPVSPPTTSPEINSPEVVSFMEKWVSGMVAGLNELNLGSYADQLLSAYQSQGSSLIENNNFLESWTEAMTSSLSTLDPAQVNQFVNKMMPIVQELFNFQLSFLGDLGINNFIAPEGEDEDFDAIFAALDNEGLSQSEFDALLAEAYKNAGEYFENLMPSYAAAPSTQMSEVVGVSEMPEIDFFI
ncbi:hypothetical protein O1D97_06755 [Marinomonas sp. 15G1-11]|uniref:Uncharacterized protein n=1 Tax=Marinomonas phaeophyticola TaxID=3004091 RepID=A0ABT4JSP4_9GAMM|nr:hypothetical protein [Marinomonas sp. 15G1-11]MCZ2721355.1 hypothetical protein [Marinomonas sp. 15G1-11]